MRRILSLLGLVVLSSLNGRGATQDWPWWRGPGRDGRAQSFVAPSSWPTHLTRLWRTPVGAGDATPALVDGRLYAFGRLDDTEVVFCLDDQDGRELWRYAYPAVRVTGPAEKYPGPRSSPAVADGKVVVLGVGGVLTCLEADSGRVVWRHAALAPQVPRFFTAMSPLVVGEVCVVHLGGQGAGLLAALALSSGQVRWQWKGEGPAYASPTVLNLNGARQVVVQTEQSLSGFALHEGRRLWRVPTPPQPGYWNSVTPVVAGATVFYTGQGTGTRAVRVTPHGQECVAEPRWHNPELGTVYNTPVLKGGALFGLSDRGRLFCLEEATGATRWVSTNRFSYFGPVVDAGTVLVALPERSGLIFFEPTPEGYRELARYPVSATPVYAHPVLAGDRVFVRDAESVTAWRLDASKSAKP